MDTPRASHSNRLLWRSAYSPYGLATSELSDTASANGITQASFVAAGQVPRTKYQAPCTAPAFSVQTLRVSEDASNIPPRGRVVVYEADREFGFWQYANPFAAARRLWSLRQLGWRFVVREVHGRYRGSYMGIFWAMITPLLSLAVYTFIFVGIAGMTWPQTSGIIQPALYIFSGLIAFSVFSECVNRAPFLITGNPNYVKKVVFPLELLPVSALGAAVIHSLFSLAIALAVQLATTGRLHWTLVLLPLAYLPLVALSLGLAWILATLGVFIRDIGNLMGIVVQILMFLTPIFFPLDRVPGRPIVRDFLKYNPLAVITDGFRRIINESRMLDWTAWGIVTVFALLVAMAGYMFFKRMERSLADVI